MNRSSLRTAQLNYVVCQFASVDRVPPQLVFIVNRSDSATMDAEASWLTSIDSFIPKAKFNGGDF